MVFGRFLSEIQSHRSGDPGRMQGAPNRRCCRDERIHGGGVGNGLVSEQVSDLSLDNPTFVIPLSLCSLFHSRIRSVQGFLKFARTARAPSGLDLAMRLSAILQA